MSVKVAKVTSATVNPRERRNEPPRSHEGTKTTKVHEEILCTKNLRVFVTSWLTFLEQQAAERRHDEPQRLIEAVRRDWLRRGAPAVADVAAAEDVGVAVQQLRVPARLWHADAVLHARHRREVEHH